MFEFQFKKLLNDEIVSLYEDIVNYSKYCEPMRSVVFRRLQYLVSKTFTGAGKEITLKKYGSWVTNLLIPESDIDQLICGADVVSHDDAVQILNTFTQNLELFQWVQKTKCLDRAQIPIQMIEADPFNRFDIGDIYNKILGSTDPQIIKNLNLNLPLNNPFHPDNENNAAYTKKMQGNENLGIIKVDISVESNQATAQRTTHFQQMAVKHYYSLSLLVILLKYFLQIKGLNKPYNGGLSSYAITQIVMAWLEDTRNVNNKNYVELFLGQVYFYGYKFDPKIRGIHFYFGAQDRDTKHSPYFDLNMYDLVDRGQIFIADPTQPPFKNVSPNAFQFGEIQNQLRKLWDKLSECKVDFQNSIQNWRKTDENGEGDQEDFIKKGWKDKNLIIKVFSNE